MLAPHFLAGFNFLRFKSQYRYLRPLFSTYSPPTDDDTIFALATGLAVVRISGSDSRDSLKALMSQTPHALPHSSIDKNLKSKTSFPKPRFASLRKLYDPRSGGMLDEALVLFFPKPHSFTGEDVVELHLHGSRAVVSGVLDTLQHLHTAPSACSDSESENFQFPRLRIAERGEFTRRAYENGRLGLTEVEGLGDLLTADTEAQRRQALHQMGGSTEKQFLAWRKDVQGLLAHVEAVIDFGDDDESVDETAVLAGLTPKVLKLVSEMRAHLHRSRCGEMIRSGVEVAIIGPPNAGKSTLMNLLAAREVAIVSDVAGTTRDVLEVRLDLGGIAVVVRDTAGIHTEAILDDENIDQSKKGEQKKKKKKIDAIEAEGIKRAIQAARTADLVLFVVDATSPAEAYPAFELLDNGNKIKIQEFSSCLKQFHDGFDSLSNSLVLVFNKYDKLNDFQNSISDRFSMLSQRINQSKNLNTTVENDNIDSNHGCLVSCHNGEGVNELIETIEYKVNLLIQNQNQTRGQEDPYILTRERHRSHAQGCIDALEGFLIAVGGPVDFVNNDHHHHHGGALSVEVAAEELRIAARELGRVVGNIDVEEVLDVLFREFCIGK